MLKRQVWISKEIIRNISIILTVVLFLSVLFVPIRNTKASNVTVTIDTTDIIVSDILGVGGEYDPFQFMPESIANGYNEAYWELEKMRVNRMGFKIARMWFQPDWFMDDWSTNYDWDTDRMEAVYTFCQGMKDTGVEILLDFGWKISRDAQSWMALDGVPTAKQYKAAPDDLDSWARACSDLLDKLINEKGFTNIKYLTCYNEPNLSDFNTEGTTVNKNNYYRDMMYKIHNKLTTDNRRSLVEIWGAEESGTTSFADNLAGTYPQVCDAYSFHNYGGLNWYDTAMTWLKGENIQGAYSVMTETAPTAKDSIADLRDLARNYIYGFKAGHKAVMPWRLNDQYFPDPLDTTVVMQEMGHWNWYPDSLDVKPGYYITSLMTKYVDKGANVFDSISSNFDIETVVFKNDDGNYTILAYNLGTSSHSVQFNFGTNINKTFHRHLATNYSSLTHKNAQLINDDQSFSATTSFTDASLPAGGVAVYSSKTPALQVIVTPNENGTAVAAGGTKQFSVTFIDGGGGVTWSVVGGSGNGTINSSGLYTAPLGASGDMVAVKATSIADSSQYGIALVKLNGGSPPNIIVDNSNATFTGTWNTSTGLPDYYSTNYQYNVTGTGSDKVKWTPSIPTAGNYRVYYWLPDGNGDRPTNARYTVYYNGGSKTYFVNQQGSGGSWVYLGSHNFASGTSGYVELTDDANNNYVIADAIGLLYETPAATEIIIDNTSATYTGVWNNSTGLPDYYNTNYEWNATGAGSDIAKWTPNITAGEYEVYYWLPDGNGDRPTNAPYKVVHSSGSNTYYINQQVAGGSWKLLGTHTFNAGTGGYVELSDNCNNNYVIADAIKFKPIAVINYAASATITHSSSYETSSWGKAKVNDGNRDSISGSYGWSRNNSLSTQHTEWIKLDLGSSKSISKVDLFPRDDASYDGYYFPVDFTIQVSTDDSNYTTKVTRNDYSQPNDQVQSFSFTATNARYVKINATELRHHSTYRMQFAEIEIY
jgi:hypothetical protein